MKKILFFILFLVIILALFLFNLDNIPFIKDNISEENITKIQNILPKIGQSKINQDLTTFVNTDSNSNIAIVVKAENGEGVVVFTNNEKKIDKVVFMTADGKTGIMKINNLGQPTELNYEGTIATFVNYTDTTVDINVKRTDGTQESFKKSSISSLNLSFIPKTMAYSVSEYMSGLGTAMNVVGCGVGLGSILFSGGLTSPLAYLGCASLTTRMLTLNTEIGSCKGDVLDCAKDAILGSLIETTQEHGPDFLRKGFKMKGIFKNSITKKSILLGTILADNKSYNNTLRGDWENDFYELYFNKSGVYSVETVSEGFADSKFDVIVTPTKAQVRIPNQKLAFEKKYETKDYAEMEMDFLIDPEGFIRGEIIDSVEGDSIKDAKIFLLDNNEIVAEDFTETSGEFIIEPPLNTEAKDFILKIEAKDYLTQNINIHITYDIKENSDEYEIENWTGIVKMVKGKELWHFTLSNSIKELSMCNNNFIKMLNENAMVFDINEKGDIYSSVIKENGFYTLTGSVNYNKIDLLIESSGFFTTKLETVVHLVGNFPLNHNKTNGTWSKPVPSHISKGERHHYIGCEGTWTAEKR